MNVTFTYNERVNGFIIRSGGGLTRFVAVNDDVSIVFETEAGAGRNYFNVIRYTDKRTNRTYTAQRYLLKWIIPVRELSGVLYMRYREANNV